MVYSLLQLYLRDMPWVRASIMASSVKICHVCAPQLSMLGGDAVGDDAMASSPCLSLTPAAPGSTILPQDITRPTETHEAKAARENAALVLEGRTRHGVADPPPAKSPEPHNSSGGWTDSQLLAMAQRKEQLWNSMVLRGGRGHLD